MLLASDKAHDIYLRSIAGMQKNQCFFEVESVEIQRTFRELRPLTPPPAKFRFRHYEAARDVTWLIGFGG